MAEIMRWLVIGGTSESVDAVRYLQSLGKALASTLISLVREVVFGVGFALLLPRFFGLDGVLYSMPVSDILTFLIAAVIIARTYKELTPLGQNRTGGKHE